MSENIYTEDDTFNRLRRCDVNEMVRLLAEHERSWRRAHDGAYPTTQNIYITNLHGWNWGEFLHAKRAGNPTIFRPL